MTITHLDLAEYCEKAYKVRTHSIDETDAYVIIQKKYCIIAFTGTETDTLWPFTRGKKTFDKQSITNWIDIVRDLKFFRKRHFKFGRIHRGFYKGAKHWTREYSHLFEKDTPIYITGHSKGAAEGAQVARMMKVRGYNIKEVVLFAEPASHYIGSRKHFDSLHLNVTTYINGSDIIRWMPPWGRRSCRTTFVGKKGFIPSVKHHGMQNYTNEMRIPIEKD